MAAVPQSSPGSNPREKHYDLSHLSAHVRRAGRLARWIVVGVALLLLATFVAIGGPSWIYSWLIGAGFPTGPSGLNVAKSVGLLGASAFLMGTIYFTDPGPVVLILDSSGIRLRYNSGKERTWLWSNPRFRLDVYDYHNLPETLPKRRLPYEYCLRDGNDAFLTPLTPPAFSDLLSAAQLEGLRIEAIKPQMHWAGGEIPNARVLRLSHYMPELRALG